METVEIRSGAVYETIHQQLRRVLRLTSMSVYYETIGAKRPFYTSCVRLQSFAADAVREHKITAVVTSRRRREREEPPRADGSIRDSDLIEQSVEIERRDYARR